MRRLKSRSLRKFARARRRTLSRPGLSGLEILEHRELLATFTVTNLHNSGAGSLRQAIIGSNNQPGADTIDFDVAGTIRIGRTSLPAITDTVTIDGSTAPSFVGSPVVSVNFQGTKGLRFAPGAAGSTLQSLSLVKAGNAGVTLNASRVTVQGNYIGIQTNGKTVAGNRGDGVQINASSHGDLIGQSNPVTGVSYYTASTVTTVPVSGWQGIRNSDVSGQYLIAGTSGANGLLYEGPITGSGGTSYFVNFPVAATTSVYGPDDVGNDSHGNDGLRLVGSYKNDDGTVHGFVYQGTTADLAAGGGDYQTIDYPNATYTYVHSTMGDLAVGNADGPEGNAPIGTGHAFMYDVTTSTFLPDIVYPGATSTTAYGIWFNGGTSYTIAGGYTNLKSPGSPVANGYLVDYDSATGQYSNWTSFAYPNGAVGQDFLAHFQGISSDEAGVFTLSANSVQSGSSAPVRASWVTVRLNPDGTFGPAVWVNVSYPGYDPDSTFISNDSVAGNQLVGIVVSNTTSGSGTPTVTEFSYQATVNTGFQMSNVISGNGGNGIGIYGASGNQVAMNDIGTDATGTLKRGNGKNGILVTNRAVGNIIGGQATGGNDPTGDVFVRPPQGNLISGNRGNGVLINNKATGTLLSGNFVGTAGSGNSALGNTLDGVAIVKANGNQLIGCTFQQDPFVFYNVLSGNGGNGLRVTNSNNTTVQANFMGAGANNARIVANGGDGLLVSGTSKNTQVGGVIPLGNVISGNNRNGIEVSGKASGFITFNTFAGIFAFAGPAPNKGDGMLITSTGGNNLIRTNIVSGNLGNGIELGGNATGVQVTETAVGTNSNIQTPIPNGGNGILITGHAHNNAVGGFQPSIEPTVTVSANRGYGIQVAGFAHNNVVYHTNIGTNAQAQTDLGNKLGGIDLGPGTWSDTIGGTAAALQIRILFSRGPGVTINSSRGDTVSGNEISGSKGNGVTIMKAKKLTVGGNTLGAGNGIVTNLGYGLYAAGLCAGSIVQANVIAANVHGNVNMSKSRGLTYIPTA